jgi:hypothetical protein
LTESGIVRGGLVIPTGSRWLAALRTHLLFVAIDAGAAAFVRARIVQTEAGNPKADGARQDRFRKFGQVGLCVGSL